MKTFSPDFCVYLIAGDKLNTASSDLSSVLPEEVEQEVKEAAEISMGTEVSEEDINNIIYLCDQVISMFYSLRLPKNQDK